eukprot:751075-Amphidinium_carterae.2
MYLHCLASGAKVPSTNSSSPAQCTAILLHCCQNDLVVCLAANSQSLESWTHVWYLAPIQ